MILKNNGRGIGCNTPSPVAFIIILLFFQLILLGNIPSQAAAATKEGEGISHQLNEVGLEKIMEILTNKLELNQGQITEVQPIMENFLVQSKKLKVEAMGSQNSAAPGASTQEIDFLVQKTMDQIDGFLSEEQSEKFKELVQAITQKEGLQKLFGFLAPVWSPFSS